MNIFTRRATTAVAALALTLSGAFVAVAPAQATTTPPAETTTPLAQATFTSLTISGLKSKYALSAKGKEYKFVVNVTGTEADTSYTDTNGDGLKVRYTPYGDSPSYPSVTVVKSLVKNPYKPSISYPYTLAAGKNVLVLKVSKYVSPGVYKITVPVKQTDSTTLPFVYTVKYVTKKVTINASPKLSTKATSLSAPSWKAGKTAKLTITAPEYQRGALVTLYVKKKGAKKYVKHTSGKLKVKFTRSKVLLKGKNLRVGDKIYFKIAKAKYAPAYKTKVVPIKKV
ncbi:hypothetical protein IGS67_10790 [Flavimobilis sp. GY10621]|uniref:Uncharacterized protein n=1 Tax=Flavimobilis rhizosphaerae TaxID=2775421 RepID=A0ABR9DSI4_9MICO|nr:hypothetical protein [Flavimobilis rhizosphaerae]MBD9699973.1 hypothetical protein [Flavimobilis rhizosphaerae]